MGADRAPRDRVLEQIGRVAPVAAAILRTKAAAGGRIDTAQLRKRTARDCHPLDHLAVVALTRALDDARFALSLRLAESKLGAETVERLLGAELDDDERKALDVLLRQAEDHAPGGGI